MSRALTVVLMLMMISSTLSGCTGGVQVTETNRLAELEAEVANLTEQLSVLELEAANAWEGAYEQGHYDGWDQGYEIGFEEGNASCSDQNSTG